MDVNLKGIASERYYSQRLLCFWARKQVNLFPRVHLCAHRLRLEVAIKKSSGARTCSCAWSLSEIIL
jgi:hypothetical protein